MAISKTSILVIEDVQAMRFHLKQMLQEMGFTRIQTASSVEQAQLILMVEVVDLILCDWHLNPSSGIDLLKEVRTKRQYDGTAFVMLTAENTKEKVIEAIKAGVDDYLVKPIAAATLLSKVGGVLAKRSHR